MSVDVAMALGAHLAAAGAVTANYTSERPWAPAETAYAADFMPDKPDKVVVSYEVPAGAVLPGTDEVPVAIQLNVRDSDPGSARAKAWLIHDLIADKSFTVAGRSYLCTSRGVPAKLREDEAGRSVYVLNVTVITPNS